MGHGPRLGSGLMIEVRNTRGMTRMRLLTEIMTVTVMFTRLTPPLRTERFRGTPVALLGLGAGWCGDGDWSCAVRYSEGFADALGYDEYVD